MPYRALIDGERRVSFQIPDAEWLRLRARRRAGEWPIRMKCCDSAGVPKTSPLGRRFFAHYDQPEDCNWQPESPEHLEIKHQVYEAVAGTPGWTAELEVGGDGWRADVLAVSDDVQVAFEVQISGQGQAETAERNEVREFGNVIPWWLVTRRNAGKGFGVALTTEILAKSPETGAAAARTVLSRAKRHVQIAKAVASFFDARGIPYETAYFCRSVPVAFSIAVGGKRQWIAVGELGDAAFAGVPGLRRQSRDNPWGSVAQFVSEGGKQAKGLGSTAFYVRGDPVQSVSRALAQLVDGDLVWIDVQARWETGFVWYRTTCASCDRPFARVPFAITGHVYVREDEKPRLVEFHLRQSDAEMAAALRQVERRAELKVGEAWCKWTDRWRSGQLCPHCGCRCEGSLMSAGEALHGWPSQAIDWIRWKDTRTRAGRWASPRSFPRHTRRSAKAWTDLLADKIKPRPAPLPVDPPVPWADEGSAERRNLERQRELELEAMRAEQRRRVEEAEPAARELLKRLFG